MQTIEMRADYIFPARETKPDRQSITILSQAAERLGFDAILVPDHVILGREKRGNNGYTYEVPFFEPLTFFSFLSAITEKIKFIPAVLVLPQRNTVLVAKQTAMIQNFSKGRFTMGVGVGSSGSENEFAAMDAPFRNRGPRMEEQIEVMRLLWENDLITFEGRYHHLKDEGINPRPLNKIPVFMGGWADKVLLRIARMADGWMPMRDVEQIEKTVDLLRGSLEKNGRDPENFPIIGGFGNIGGFGRESKFDIRELMLVVKRLEKVGATAASFGTQGFGLGSDPEKHVELLTKMKKEFDNRI